MSTIALLVLAVFSQVASPGNAALPTTDPSFEHVIIQAEHDVHLSAQVEGLLTRVAVTEGARVRQGDILAMLDDRQAQAALAVAQAGYYSADEKANDKIEQRYAEKAAAVAQKDYEMAFDANLQAKSTGRQPVVSQIDVDKKKLDWDRAKLQIEKALKDQRLARLDADVKQAELDAAKVAIARRTLDAPFDGEVTQLNRRESEWANPGDEVLRLVQFDVMHVECLVSSEDFDPAELQGRPVTVVVELARNRKATVQGHVIYASQMVIDSTGGHAQYRVRAEVKNQRQGDFWLVRPGLSATMTIHVNQAPITAESAQAAPVVEQR